MNGANIIAFIILVAIVITVVVYLLHWLYRRSTKDVSFVRTGMGGQQVVIGGGRFVLPIVHEITEVGMKTLRLEVQRTNEKSIITKDRLRVDLQAEFYVRVRPDDDSVATAAQTLGRRTLEPESLKELVEGRFIDALRSVAAGMTMEEMHEQRGEYVKAVKVAVEEALLRSGLELETVSLTGLDQTEMKFFNPSNTFDAEGLTRITESIESRKKMRNDIEQDTMIEIRNKNLETEKTALEITRESEYARMEQEREVSLRRHQQRAQVAQDKAEREREIEEAQITAHEQVEKARIAEERVLEGERISREQYTEHLEIERRKALEIEELERAIAVAEKSQARSEAEAEAERARGQIVAAEEEVKSSREESIAERRMHIEIIEAKQRAERDAIHVRIAAEAEKKAAEDRGEAEKFGAYAAKVRYEIDAEGRRALNESENLRSEASRRSALRMKIAENLEGIIRESVKPMEQISDIKILQVDGLPGFSGNTSRGESGGSSDEPAAQEGAKQIRNGSLADEMVNSALRYRSHAPFVDGLLGEIGMSPSEITKIDKLLDVSAPKSSGGRSRGPAE
jgi:uncharacterized membrane protein YqiK